MLDPSLFLLKGRITLFTGSSAGLGKARSADLGRADEKVALNYPNNTARAEGAFAELASAGIEGRLVRGVGNCTAVATVFLSSEAAAFSTA